MYDELMKDLLSSMDYMISQNSGILLIDDEEHIKLIRSLVEKQISRNPIVVHYEYADHFVCPNENCNGGHRTKVYDGENYCTDCGQKLSWGWNNE